jgi:hypothetical protein
MHLSRSHTRLPLLIAALVAALVATLATPPAHAAPPPHAASQAASHGDVRIATFNASLYRGSEGALVEELSTQDSEHAQLAAETIQRQRPDILLVNEFDYDAEGLAADLFHDNYLAVAQHSETEAIEYPYRLQFASNTGIPSGHDLNNDGVIGESGDAYAQDSFGYGWFPGQYAFAVFSKHPILEEDIRTFQEFLWADMPGALLPDDPETAAEDDWYSPEELEVFRLSSKNHVDVPIQVGKGVIHLLASHPTPPAFDGPEQRNVLRNHDEVRFWADYISPGKRSAYIYDDEGETGGLEPGSRFVIAGDLNVDPCDGDGVPGTIQQLLDHPLVRDPLPASEGAVEQAQLQGRTNLEHCNPPRYDTADFSERIGNLRVDYVLPRKGLRVTDTGVFWPTTDWEHFDRLIGTWPFPVTDHRMVHVDVALPIGGRR